MVKLTRRNLLQAAATGSLLPQIMTAAGATQPSVNMIDQVSVTELPMRRQLLDFDWRFHLGHAVDSTQDFNFGTYQRTYAKAGSNTADAAQRGFDDSDWQVVQLPHDWAVFLPFAPSTDTNVPGQEDPRAAHGFKPLGRDYPATSIGWYRRLLEVDAQDLGKRICIEFDGVFRNCIVFCNGHIVGQQASGYCPFSVDLSDFLNYGEPNVIAVRVDATLGEGWFYEGAGIYRHVWLSKTEPLHIPQHGVYVRSEINGATARIIVSTEIRNQQPQTQACSLLNIIYDPKGRIVASQQSTVMTLAANALSIVEQQFAISEPLLWSLDTPQQYRVHSEIRVNDDLHDVADNRFGIRTLRFDAQQGLFLNGQPVKLKGTCNHQDHAGVGSAIPDRLQEWRIEQLQAMGSNAYRSSHNPATPELLEVCDRLGMLVINEVRLMSSDAEGLAQLERMIRSSRNHPSIILWSLGNEEPQMTTARGARIVSRMKQLANRLDPSRECIFAMDKGWDQGAGKVVDVVGFNYRINQMGDFHQRFPNIPILGTEAGSTVCTRGIYRHNDNYVRAYDIDHPWWASTAEAWWSYVAQRDYIAGGFIWTGFDYRGEPTPFNHWPNISSNFGVLDTCGFAKDNFWYYQAQWTNKPVLHLLPHWNWTAAMLKDGAMVDVWCHSNLDEVELLVNGSSHGRQPVPRYGHAEWRVKYVAGVIEARGYRGGELLLTDRRETADAPAAIQLNTDRSAIRADGRDLAMLAVQIVDNQNRFMPIADSLVTFNIIGPGKIIGVGNGNPISHEADQAMQRRAFNGLCQAIVKSLREPGLLTITASSPGLRSASITITVS